MARSKVAARHPKVICVVKCHQHQSLQATAVLMTFLWKTEVCNRNDVLQKSLRFMPQRIFEIELNIFDIKRQEIAILLKL